MESIKRLVLQVTNQQKHLFPLKKKEQNVNQIEYSFYDCIAFNLFNIR